MKKTLLILGGGFAGVWGALAAAEKRRRYGTGTRDLAITLVSRDPWLTIRPRLYEASLDDVRVPLADVLGPAGVELVQGEVTRIDHASRTVGVEGAGGARVLAYDRVLLAAGSRVQRPPIPGLEHAFSVDTYAEAVALQRHLERLPGRAGAPARFTSVVVGAGFTGLETVTELAGRLRALAAGDAVRVVLVDSAPTVARDLGGGARPHVEAALATLGIEPRVGRAVSAIHPDGVMLAGGEWLAASTTVWTAGMRASPLGAQLPVARDELGRLPVDPLLRVEGVDGIYAAGDVARVMADEAHALPMSCQFAIPLGERAGANAAADLLGRAPRPFVAAPYVTCLDLGAAGALFMQGWDREVALGGYWAKVMKETINRRLIYPPREPVSDPGLRSAA